MAQKPQSFTVPKGVTEPNVGRPGIVITKGNSEYYLPAFNNGDYGTAAQQADHKEAAQQQAFMDALRVPPAQDTIAKREWSGSGMLPQMTGSNLTPHVLTPHNGAASPFAGAGNARPAISAASQKTARQAVLDFLNQQMNT